MYSRALPLSSLGRRLVMGQCCFQSVLSRFHTFAQAEGLAVIAALVKAGAGKNLS